MTTPAAEPLPELLTCNDPRVRACTAGGVEHDYRPYTRTVTTGVRVALLPEVANVNAPTVAELAAAQTMPAEQVIRREHYLRCVWCHAVTCGNTDETDPCIEPYHHRVPHRTRLGTTWPIGGVRPHPEPKGTRP